MKAGAIKQVIVLMLENRSFDHLYDPLILRYKNDPYFTAFCKKDMISGSPIDCANGSFGEN